MSVLSNNKYKEKSPESTVTYIRSILENLGIEMEEIWAPENIIGTFSLRLVVKGSSIGTNGKGMTREYARASAYAEFMERLQNGKLISNATWYNYLKHNISEFNLAPDEVRVSVDDWLRENNVFCRQVIKELKLENADHEKLTKEISRLSKIDYAIFGQKRSMICLPYYSYLEKRTINLPYFAMSMHYGSNGMCAGNMQYEALVQGISEIIERFVQKKIIEEKKCFPDIPEEYLKKYEDIYEMYAKCKASDKCDIFIKDCSCGGKFPAAALVLVEKNTGNFGIKVGCNPDFRIALERLFTEAAQGLNNIEEYARKTSIDFENKYILNDINILNGFRTGNSRYPYQFFGKKYDYEFSEIPDVTDLSNEEIFCKLINLFTDDGYDVLIRDVSFLGFPSYHVIIPGLSEMKSPSANDYEADHTRFHVEKLINNPELINSNNCKYVIQTIDYYKNCLNINQMRDFSGYLPDKLFPADEYSLDSYYFAAMCYVVAGDYENASAVMHNINTLILYNFRKTDWHYVMLEKYLCGMKVLGNHKKVLSFLDGFYDVDAIKYLDEVFGQQENVIIKQYSLIDGSNKCDSYNALERVNNRIRIEQSRNQVKQYCYQ